MKNVKDFHENKVVLTETFRQLMQLHESMKQVLHVEILDKERVKKLDEQLESDKFTVAVVGVIKRGKSTLLNALMETEREIFPTDVTPETARLSYLQYGEVPSAVVHFVGEGDECIKIDLDDLEQYTSAPGPGKKGIAKLNQKTKYAEIFYPNKYLKNDVVLVDTPGVDDPDQSRSDVTLNFIVNADAVIFMISATDGGLKDTELKFIRSRLLSNGNQKGIIVAINRIGELRKRQLSEELPKITSDTKHLLEREFHIAVPVLEIDAKDAWEGKIRNDPAQYQKSRFTEFLTALETMLIETKGAILLGKRSTEMKYDIIKPIRQHLDYEAHATNRSVEELKVELLALYKEVEEQKALFDRLKIEYARKIRNAQTTMETNIRQALGTINVSDKKVQDDLNGVFSKVMVEVENAFNQKILAILHAYKEELGAGNINIESIDFTIDHPQMDVGKYFNAKEKKSLGSVNEKAVRTAAVAGFLSLGPVGGFVAGVVTMVATSLYNMEKETIYEFDIDKFKSDFDGIKRNIVKLYSKKMEVHTNQFDQKVAEWFEQQTRSYQNKQSVIEKKKSHQENEHQKFLENISKFQTQAVMCEAALDRIYLKATVNR